ncbi:RagB/SusD family nutrient uptake outer membrane protein [Mucilaginibacter sp.]|uniref:RagB/SusD family nutrient uptake outer membrane protein n=1 Tax=Mucilaginibacter sp. TaxID=1882438 RepID=UPI00260BDDCF|nr:RagB/SusD family nutrient uptake outer membrane protein [Mucilaginibacter sp.]MDB4925984.1 RagB/SusD family nutrient uptake outer membrane protein [Mucilaginibacter sp.]
MKNKNIKLTLALFAVCLTAACKKELNVYPTTSEVDGNVIVDAKSASTVLNGVYYRFANGGVDNNSIPSVLWTNVNEIFPSELSGALTNSSGNDGNYSFTFTALSTGGVTNKWNYGYALVNAANGFLKNVAPVTTIPAATKTQMIAEAKFLRAFANEELLLYYGQYYDVNSKYGIILRDEFVDATNINLPRSGVSAAYTSILADLDAAIAGLPALNTQIYYANVSAAKLLKARVLINRGSSGDYAQVVSLTNDVITNGGFTLEANLKDIFWTKGFASKEVILGVQPFSTETYKFRQNQYYNQYPVSASFITLLANDPRNQWVYQPYTLRGTVIGQLTKYYSGSPSVVVQTPLSEHCYAFRLTEAYLLEAEAITLSNGDLSKAKPLLTTVMGHAGLTDYSAVNNATTAAALQVLIVQEEMKNFVAENGADWFALRRLPFATLKTMQPYITTINQLILPIPNSEITANGQIFPNP